MLFNQSASTNCCAHRLDKLQRQEDQERFHQIQEAYKVLLDASKRAMHDVEVSPSHPHPVDSFRWANICCQMARRVTKMQQYVIMMKQVALCRCLFLSYMSPPDSISHQN